MKSDELPKVPPPSPTRRLEVIHRNDSLGGKRRLGVCRPEDILYRVPRPGNLPNGQPMPPRRFHVGTAACGTENLIAVAYDASGVRGLADVCIEDDAVDRWPRFQAPRAAGL